jgi:hypothetical protein
MNNPYVWLPGTIQGYVLAVLFGISLVLMFILSAIGNGLTVKEKGIPYGIITIEMPLNQQNATSIVNVWNDRHVTENAVKQTRLDFLFLLFYPAALSLACVLLDGSTAGLTSIRVGIILSWGVLFCIPLDACENILILKMLSGCCHSPIPEFTTLVAALKFFLITISLIYLLIGLVCLLIQRL